MEGAVQRRNPRIYRPVYQYIPTRDYRRRRLGSLVCAKEQRRSIHAYSLCCVSLANGSRPAGDGYCHRDAGYYPQFLPCQQHGRRSSDARDSAWRARGPASQIADSGAFLPTAYADAGYNKNAGPPAIAYANPPGAHAHACCHLYAGRDADERAVAIDYANTIA